MLKQSGVKSAYLTPASPINDRVDPGYRKSVDGKFVTDDDRPLSPYRPHLISINGKLHSKEEITNMKEKASTGETNNICTVSKF